MQINKNPLGLNKIQSDVSSLLYVHMYKVVYTHMYLHFITLLVLRLVSEIKN